MGRPPLEREGLEATSKPRRSSLTDLTKAPRAIDASAIDAIERQQIQLRLFSNFRKSKAGASFSAASAPFVSLAAYPPGVDSTHILSQAPRSRYNLRALKIPKIKNAKW